MTLVNMLRTVQPSVALSVMASLVSSDTTRGEPPFVPRNASIALELAGQVTAIGYPGSKLPYTRPREPREGTMTFQLSHRGNEYLKTARTLLRAAKTMTDQAIADQLKALADDYQRRAEKASRFDAAKASARSAANAESEALFEGG